MHKLQQLRYWLAVCLPLALLEGCADLPKDAGPYPSDWPAIFPSAQCDAIAGVYANVAIATSSPNRTTSSPWLIPLLRNGALISRQDLAGVSGQSEVLIPASSADVSIASAGSSIRDPLKSAGEWRCLANGNVRIIFPQIQGGGEASTADHTAIIVDLASAIDGSLVVRWHMSSRGFSLIAVPYRYEAQYWMRFRRVTTKF